jgi:tRNA uridine 5-carboxymethylaminomethyl modification enzyme
LRLRSDNAASRLTPLAISVGAVGSERAGAFQDRLLRQSELQSRLQETVSADVLIKQGIQVKQDAGKMSLFDWLRFPQLSIAQLLELDDASWPQDLITELEQDGRYAPYLARQEAEINDMAANAQIRLSAVMDYRAISGLSHEMVERLEASMPENLAAASRIRGITPAALAAILVHAKRAKIAIAQAA